MIPGLVVMIREDVDLPKPRTGWEFLGRNAVIAVIQYMGNHMVPADSPGGVHVSLMAPVRRSLTHGHGLAEKLLSMRGRIYCAASQAAAETSCRRKGEWGVVKDIQWGNYFGVRVDPEDGAVMLQEGFVHEAALEGTPGGPCPFVWEINWRYAVFQIESFKGGFQSFYPFSVFVVWGEK